MNRRFFLAALAALCLAGCGSDVPRIGKIGAGDVILAFGDSLTHGTGAKAEERSGPANLNNAISGNSGHNAGPRLVWQ